MNHLLAAMVGASMGWAIGIWVLDALSELAARRRERGKLNEHIATRLGAAQIWLYHIDNGDEFNDCQITAYIHLLEPFTENFISLKDKEDERENIRVLIDTLEDRLKKQLLKCWGRHGCDCLSCRVRKMEILNIPRALIIRSQSHQLHLDESCIESLYDSVRAK